MRIETEHLPGFGVGVNWAMCPNFGIPFEGEIAKGRKCTYDDRYQIRVIPGERDRPAGEIRCRYCGESSRLASNKAIRRIGRRDATPCAAMVRRVLSPTRKSTTIRALSTSGVLRSVADRVGKEQKRRGTFWRIRQTAAIWGLANVQVIGVFNTSAKRQAPSALYGLDSGPPHPAAGTPQQTPQPAPSPRRRIVARRAALALLVAVGVPSGWAVAQETPLSIGGPPAFVVSEGTMAVATLTATGGDGSALRWALSDSPGVDGARFEIGPSGELAFVSAPDYEQAADADADGVYEVRVAVSDATETVTRDVRVTVTNVAPGLAGPAAASHPEGKRGLRLGAYPVHDGDEWSLGGPDGALFTIADGLLRFVDPPDFEAAADEGGENVYDVVVRASDGTTTERLAVAVTVTDADERGVVVLAPLRPKLGVSIEATLTEPDGVEEGATVWRWERNHGREGWVVIEGATAARYTPTAADSDRYLRASATYTDGFGAGKTAQAMVPHVVIAHRLSALALPGLTGVPGDGRGFYPAFDPDTLHYAARCTNDVTLTLTPEQADTRLSVNGVQRSRGAPVAVDGLGGESDIRITLTGDAGASTTYTVHCVPRQEFPKLTTVKSDGATEELMLFRAKWRPRDQWYRGALVMMDNNGVPRLRKWVPDNVAEYVRVFADETHPRAGYVYERQGTSFYPDGWEMVVLDRYFDTVDDDVHVLPPFSSTNGHDQRVRPNGDYVLMAYSPARRDVRFVATAFPGIESRSGGTLGANRRVLDSAIQIRTADRTVKFNWNAWDHMAIEDCIEGSFNDEYAHINSLGWIDGDILAGFRHCSKILRIDVDTGEVVWRAGPSILSRAQWENGQTLQADRGPAPLDFVNDPRGGFSGQHGGHFTVGGDLLVYDNATHCGAPHGVPEDAKQLTQCSERTRAVAYALDLDNEELVFQREFRMPGSNQGGLAGHAEPLDNGDWVVSWSNARPGPATAAHVDAETDALKLSMTIDNIVGTYEVDGPRNTRVVMVSPVALAPRIDRLEATIVDRSLTHSGATDRPRVVVGFNRPVVDFDSGSPSVAVTGAAVAVEPYERDGAPANAYAFTLTPEGDDDIRFGLNAGGTCESGAICTADGATLLTVPAVLVRSSVPAATLSAVSPTVAEGDAAQFLVRLDGTRPLGATPLTLAVEIVEQGDVLVGEIPSSVTVLAGEDSAMLTLATTGNGLVGAGGAVAATLLDDDGYTVGTATSATVTVTDADAATFTVSVDPAEVVEGDTATVTVRVANGVTFATEQRIGLSVTGVSAADYRLTPETLTLPAGAGSASASFAAARDGRTEGTEMAVVTASLDGAAVGSATVTLRDDVPTATLSATSASVSEGEAAVFALALSRALDASEAPLTAAVEIASEGGLLAGAPPTSVAVGAGESGATLSLATANDSVAGAGGTVTATLTAGAGYALGNAVSAVVTVTEDDVAAFEVSADADEIEEGDAATVTVRVANGVTFATEQRIGLSVTGVSAADYRLTPETLTLAAGADLATARFEAAADVIEEGTETATIKATLDGAAVGSARIAVSDPPVVPVPAINGVAQVGSALSATFGDEEPPEVAYQWLRGGEPIAGATGSSYAPVGADVGAPLAVRVSRRGVLRTSAPTVAVWAAPTNPPLTGGDEELVGAMVTLESTDAFLVDIAGYGQLGDVRFGSLTGGDFEVGGTRHAVTTAAVNNQGRFVLGTRPHLTGTDGLTVYWNGYRMEGFTETTLVGVRYWETAVTQPKHEYSRYWKGVSNGVRVALSIRRLEPVPAVSIAAGAATVGEGDAAEYTVTVDEAPEADLAVSVSVTDEAGTLVSASPSTVTVAAGAMSATLSLATDDDKVDEADGAVTVELLAGAGYDLGAAISATTTVTDDDEGTFEVTAAPSEIVEGGASTVTVTVAGGVTFAADVGIELAVTGVSVEDYELAPAAATLAAGQATVTATLTAVRDDDEEGAETATVTARVDGTAVGAAAVAIRDASDDASLAALELTDVDIGAFDAEVTAYAAEVAHTIKSTMVTATPADSNARVEIADAAGSTVGTARASALAEGTNEIVADVTAEDGETRQRYAVTVTREVPPPAWGTRLPARDIALADASGPTGLWSDGDTVWVADTYEGVLAYALSDGSRQADRDIWTDSVSRPMDLWSDGETLWVSDYDGGVLAYALSDGARLSEEDLDLEVLTEAGNDVPAGLWSDGTTLWVSDHADGRVYAYALSDGSRDADQEFSLRSKDLSTLGPYGLWSDGETVLTTHWTRGWVRGYRLSDGVRRSANDINAQARGNSYPRGLWSDRETLWVVDYEDRKLYAYAAPGLVQAEADAGLVLSSRASGVPGTDPGTPVSIPDAGLRSRIELALGKAPGEPVGVNEMAALEVLDARDAGVTDLAGLEQAVNLEGLDLGLNPLVDLRPLESLPALEALNLDGTSADPWALAVLTRLERLSLRDNGIEDLAGLSSLTALRVLDVGGNRIEDLSALAALAGLSSLRANGNAIGDLLPLSGLGELATLDLRDNAIWDIAPLATLRALIELDLRGNRIADFSALDGNRRLVVLGGRAERRAADARER